jgi:hypothetical protein
MISSVLVSERMDRTKSLAMGTPDLVLCNVKVLAPGFFPPS